jgi:hypothetical protein
VKVALQINDNLQHHVVFNDIFYSVFFGRHPGNGDITGVAASMQVIHPQSYPQILCIRKQIAYAAES